MVVPLTLVEVPVITPPTTLAAVTAPVTLANPVIKAPVVLNTATLLVPPTVMLALPLGV